VVVASPVKRGTPLRDGIFAVPSAFSWPAYIKPSANIRFTLKSSFLRDKGIADLRGLVRKVVSGADPV